MDITSIPAWVGWVVMGIISTGAGLLVFFLKRLIGDVDRGNKELKHAIDANKKDTDQKIGALEEKLNQHISRMPFDYVLREDFIRSVSNMDIKLNKILEHLSGLKG